MRLHPFCTLNKAIRRFTWEFWKKLVWCKFWRSWEQNAEKGSFIDMDVYNKYTIYEVYKLFFKKKRCRNFVRKQLFTSTKMMLLWFFLLRPFAIHETPSVYWTTLDPPQKYPSLTAIRPKRTQRRILPEKMGKTQWLEKKLPETTKVRPWKNRPLFRKGSRRKESSSLTIFSKAHLPTIPCFRGVFAVSREGSQVELVGTY